MTQMDYFCQYLPFSAARGAREGIRKFEMGPGESVKVVGDYSTMGYSEVLTPKTFSSSWLSLLWDSSPLSNPTIPGSSPPFAVSKSSSLSTVSKLLPKKRTSMRVLLSKPPRPASHTSPCLRTFELLATPRWCRLVPDRQLQARHSSVIPTYLRSFNSSLR